MDDFAGLSLGGPSTATILGAQPPQSTSGSDLLAGLNFSSSSASTFSAAAQQPFYQQYQTPLPANLSVNQQQSMSWGNLNTASPAFDASGSSQQQSRTGATMSPPPQHTQGMRSSTPGAITLGMMGSTPTSANASANGGFSQFAQGQPQPQRPQPQQPVKQKDPFDDLLSL